MANSTTLDANISNTTKAFNWFSVFLFLGIALQATSLTNGIMEVDATLYATIAKHIAITNDWVNLIGDGHDWLDKPHLPFWITAASFKVFGINDFAYKFPAFISFLLGVLYTYKLTKKMFGIAEAQVATLIYITTLHLFLAMFDVRAEAYLTTFIIAATYHLYQSFSTKFSWHIVWAALFCAAACMTKGIFVLITIAGGFLIYWIYTQQWKEFIQPKWWLLILLVFIGILPEIYCLYQQFDMHPEKIVFGKTGVSGILFFFWDSQFGRFLNNGPIKGKGDLFFFIHTFIWAFLPWSLLAYVALFQSFKKLNSQLLILTGSAIVTFLLFSLSKFQLPHYIVILFPHFAILSAIYLVHLSKPKILKIWNIVQFIIFIIAVITIVALTFITKFYAIAWPISLALAISFVVYYFFRGNRLNDLLGKGFCFSTVLFSYLNFFFYPALMEYQGGKKAGEVVVNLRPKKTIIMYNTSAYSFEWYAKDIIFRSNNLNKLPEAIQQTKSVIVFTIPEHLPALYNEVAGAKEIGRFQQYPVSQLSMPFLQSESRNKELKYVVLLDCTLK